MLCYLGLITEQWVKYAFQRGYLMLIGAEPIMRVVIFLMFLRWIRRSNEVYRLKLD